ncbi:NAD(P)/FAD-dependent oxidoreductase, partial [Burkholderia sp. SIMBA_019]
GLELATRLGNRYGNRRGRGTQRASVTLIDRNSTHIWKPLLHEVAAGSLDPFAQELPYAAQAQWHGFDFVHGELVGLDRESRQVLLSP